MLVVLCIGIYYAGTSSNKNVYFKHRKRVDENGLLIKAKVTDKIQRKGHQVYYTYQYQLRTFAAYEQDGDYYKILKIGDVMIDTLDPAESYIYLPNVESRHY